MATKYRYEYTRGTSNKFWSCWVEGKTFHAEWGPMDQDPRYQKKNFRSEYSARQHMDTKRYEKERKGYILVSSTQIESEADRLRRMRDAAVKKELEKLGIRQSAVEIKALLQAAGVSPSTGKDEFKEKVTIARVELAKKEAEKQSAEENEKLFLWVTESGRELELYEDYEEIPKAKKA